jgi:hypothetical protein
VAYRHSGADLHPLAYGHSHADFYPLVYGDSDPDFYRLAHTDYSAHTHFRAGIYPYAGPVSRAVR